MRDQTLLGRLARLGLLAMLVCATGCATRWPTRSLTFRVVDANTQRPLPGVQAVESGYNRYLMTLVIFGGEAGEHPLPLSDANGIVVAKDLADNLMLHFSFTHAGYLPAQAQWGPGDDYISLDLPPTDPHHEMMFRPASATGLITIPLYPETTAIALYRPIWRPAEIPADILSVAEAASGRRVGTPPGGHVLAYRNQYGDYRVLLLPEKPTNGRWLFDWVQIIPPKEVALRGTSDCPDTVTGPAVTQMGGWNDAPRRDHLESTP